MSQPKPPTPNPAKDYKESLKVYLKYLPQLLQGEQDARVKWDQERIDHQFKLQRDNADELYGQQRHAIETLDPEWMRNREQLGDTVFSGLDASRHGRLPPGLEEQWNSMARGSGIAHGNDTGNAAASFEDIFKGQNLLNYQQQQESNVGAFLAGSTIPQQMSITQAVVPDRASAYVNPSAPGQMAAPNYQNQLAAFQASGAGQNPWARSAISGVSGGVNAGMMSGGNPYAIGAGAVVGGIAGYFSDARLKEKIVAVGTSPNGYPIFEFCYKDCPGRFRGTIAQSILPLKPTAVTMDGTGFWKVDYDQLDIKLEEISRKVAA